MAFWNKPQSDAPAPSPAPVSSPSKIVDADDFFKDMGRKPKVVEEKEVKSIETPEVIGLREGPAPVPECTLADYTNEINTDGLIDKAALDDGQYHGFMEDRPSDEEVAAKEAAAARKAAAAAQPAFNDPDDFFKDMGKKATQPKELAQIETPDVVGLREGPAPVAECTLADFTAEINTDGLVDKAALDDGQYHGFMDEA